MAITIITPGSGVTICDSTTVIQDPAPTTITPASSPGTDTQTPATTGVQTGGIGGLGPSVVTAVLCLLRLVSAALTIPAGQSCISRDVLIADGVEVTIEDTGEWLIL